MERTLAEQRAALAFLAANPGDREATMWLNDWVAEEVLILREQYEQGR